ncbi:CTAG/Pcc1 family, partial [Pilobolus umbonatus]
SIDIPFPNDRLASIAEQVLSVDKELRAEQVKRTLTVDKNTLKVHFQCDNIKLLRVSVNSFLESLLMVTRTMDAFE